MTSDIPTTQTVASTGVILATGDGGRTWQRQYPGPAVARPAPLCYPCKDTETAQRKGTRIVVGL